jgi:uncharacterized coiled-coil DUF342 family protein
LENNPNPLLQSIVPQFKAILDRIVQAKNNPAEIQKAVDEGKQQLDKLTEQGGEQPSRR